jgi:hypothetical protein
VDGRRHARAHAREGSDRAGARRRDRVGRVARAPSRSRRPCCSRSARRTASECSIAT